ncbi:MAG: 50S ribosomal protein L22 [Candidatus Omnitrophica bacterium]|nr:50S ribosomal protein L22 [Candidatus Omnitrophota bacterium]
MLVKAEITHIRISPTKMRQVIDLIRNKGAVQAENILLNVNKRPKEYLIKLLRSAVANAKIKGFNAEQLYVSKVVCNVGPAWKRYKAAAFGRAAPIKRRTSHVKLELDLKA